MSTPYAFLIGIGFGAAVFALGMGAAEISEWWRARNAARGEKESP